MCTVCPLVFHFDAFRTRKKNIVTLMFTFCMKSRLFMLKNGQCTCLSILTWQGVVNGQIRYSTVPNEKMEWQSDLAIYYISPCQRNKGGQTAYTLVILRHNIKLMSTLLFHIPFYQHLKVVVEKSFDYDWKKCSSLPDLYKAVSSEQINHTH